MPVTKTVTLYQYDELDDKAKEKAREWYTKTNNDNSWSEHVIADAKWLGAMLGIRVDRVYYSGFWSQGDGACFDGEYTYKKGGLKAVKAEVPQNNELLSIAKDLQRIQRKSFYRLEANTRQRGYYQHSGCMNVDVWLDGSQWNVPGEQEDDLRQALRNFADWIYSELQAAYEHETSEEVVSENILANEYTFTESGRRED